MNTKYDMKTTGLNINSLTVDNLKEVYHLLSSELLEDIRVKASVFNTMMSQLTVDSYIKEVGLTSYEEGVKADELQEEMMGMEVGSYKMMVGDYVLYNNIAYLIVRIVGNRYLLLNKESKVQVTPSPKVTKCCSARAKVVEDRYLVTAGGMIVSLVSYKIMKWANNNGDRKRILSKYK